LFSANGPTITSVIDCSPCALHVALDPSLAGLTQQPTAIVPANVEVVATLSSLQKQLTAFSGDCKVQEKVDNVEIAGCSYFNLTVNTKLLACDA
jgi:hypothetical protein